MSSIDGGHYFLTVLAPVRDEAEGGTDHQTTAPMILLRERLATMPTAMQTPASTASGVNSPFSRSRLTHFARFAVVSQLGFNGVQSPDPIKAKLGISDPLVRHDDLSCHYLLFTSDFDAPSGSRSADLAAYLRELWDVMEAELRSVFKHCVGFDEARIQTAADFIAYIKSCELETTLPFNYYWGDSPTLPTLTMGKLAIRGGLAALVFGPGLWAVLKYAVGAPGWLAVTAAIIAGLVATIYVLAGTLRDAGDRRFPASPDGDLESVLKAMFLQHSLADFVTANQSADTDQLYEEFGKFLEQTSPSQSEPSHPAGEACSGEHHLEHSLSETAHQGSAA